MKQLLIIPLVLLFSLSTNAQESNKEKRRTIEVKGTAEMEVIPDELYFRIALKEYKDGSRKKNINQLEAELVKAVEGLKLPENNLQVENIYGYNWDHKKKESDEFFAIKSFILKVSDLKQMNDLLASLDPEGINSSGVMKYSHSKIDEYNRELKIKALKSAKEKAGYLLAAIDENLGKAVEIQEIEYGYQPVYARSSFSKAEADSNYQSNLEFKTINLKSEIRAVFSIK